LRPLVTIAITAEAFAIFVATLPDGYRAELRPDGNGGFVVTLPNGILDGLEVLRGPGERKATSLSHSTSIAYARERVAV
jgi:hypothetical protein